MNYTGFVILASLFLLASCASPSAPIRPVARVPKLVAATPAPTDIPAATPTYAPTATAAPTRTPKPGQVVWRGDLHMHTTCSDGHDRYEEMAEKALERGLDFIAITDHVGIAERSCHSESNLKCEAETRLLCFPGAELTARLHLLAIGIHQRIDPQLPLDAWVREIHRQGGLAMAAHPYDKRWKYTKDELLHSDLDAMECARGTAEENRQQLLLSDQYHIPCVYNSDAHYQKDVGWRYNECSVPINSLADLKAALQGNKCKRGQ